MAQKSCNNHHAGERVRMRRGVEACNDFEARTLPRVTGCMSDRMYDYAQGHVVFRCPKPDAEARLGLVLMTVVSAGLWHIMS